MCKKGKSCSVAQGHGIEGLLCPHTKQVLSSSHEAVNIAEFRFLNRIPGWLLTSGVPSRQCASLLICCDRCLRLALLP